MTKIKLFGNDRLSGLQEEINNWLNQNLNITIQKTELQANGGSNSFNYVLMIMYEVETDV